MLPADYVSLTLYRFKNCCYVNLIIAWIKIIMLIEAEISGWHSYARAKWNETILILFNDELSPECDIRLLDLLNNSESFFLLTMR